MLRRSRAIVLAAALVLACAPAVGAAAAPAAAPRPSVSTVPTTIAGLTLSAPTQSLVRAQLEVLTVRLHLVDPDGVVPRRADFADRLWSCPCVLLGSFTSSGAPYRASSQATGTRIVSLALVSGTAQDGVWRGSTILGATDAGFWRPTAVAAGDFFDENEQHNLGQFVAVPEDLKAAVSFNLRGYDWPVLSVRIPTTVTPVGAPFLLRGAVMTSRSRQPLPGLRVLTGTRVCSAHEHPAGVAVRTTSTGGWALTSTDPAVMWCAWWAPDANGFPVNLVQARGVHVRATVTVRASSTVVRTGARIAVTGVVKPATGGGMPTVIWLEAFNAVYGQWIQPVYTRALPDGSYRMTYVVYRGTTSLRVHVPSTSEFYGTTSATITVHAY